MIPLACAVLTLAVAAYVFWLPAEIAAGPEKGRLDFLQERKDVAYENLRDLNFEHRAGKLGEADFEAMRGSMEAEAGSILSEIERLEKDSE